MGEFSFLNYRVFQGFRLTPVANFINILRAAFYQYSFAKKLQSQTVIREKLRKRCASKKCERKMLMKLTLGQTSER